MKKNRILALVTALLLVISGFSAFAETAFEDIEFPDAMPSEPTLAEESYYDYDDMSQHYDLTFFIPSPVGSRTSSTSPSSWKPRPLRTLRPTSPPRSRAATPPTCSALAPI